MHIFGTRLNGWGTNMMVRWSHRCPWKYAAQFYQDFSTVTSLVVNNEVRMSFLEYLWWGDQPLCSRFLNLLCHFSNKKGEKNLTISIVLHNSFPFSTNFKICCNLTDTKIELLQRLVSFLNSMHLSPLVVDSKVRSLSSSSLLASHVFVEIKSPLIG